jgi:hypothetical protein
VSSEGSPTRSEHSSYTEYTSPTSSISDGSHSHSHYRGITFNDILSPHMITSAPPPAADAAGGRKQKRRRHPKATSSSSSAAEHPSPSRQSVPPSSWTSTMDPMGQPRPPSKRNHYPESEKKLSGGRMRATARAVARGLSVLNVKRDSPAGRRSGFDSEAV